jgi:hypothetical protein
MWRVVLGAIAFAAFFVSVGVALGAGPASTTFVLSCDRNVADAEAHVQLYTGDPQLGGLPVGDPIMVTCGPDSVSRLRTERLKVALEAEWADVIMFLVRTPSFHNDCTLFGPSDGELTLKLDCPGAETPRATLVIR